MSDAETQESAKTREDVETHAMIAVSAEHLRPATHAMLHAAGSGGDDDLPLFYAKTGGVETYGYFVPLLEPHEVEIPAGCPDELAALMAWALARGATWLMVDRDAPLVEGLPFFEQTPVAEPPCGVPAPLHA